MTGNIERANGLAKALEARVAALEEAVAHLNKRQGEQGKTLDSLATILQGDPRLNVPPLRDDVKALSEELHGVQRNLDRAKWVAVGLGTTSGLATLTQIASLILGGGGIP